MKIFTRVFFSILMLMTVSACQAGEGFKNIRYEVRAYDRWPLIVFLETPNIPENRALHPPAMARNSGYNIIGSTIPARNIRQIPGKPNIIEFDITWYERVTRNVYFAKMSVDARKLQPDRMNLEFGVLIFRISGKGDIQAVTYDVSQSDIPKAIVLSELCAEKIILKSDTKIASLNRLLNEPLIKEGATYHAKSEDIPSRCN